MTRKKKPTEREIRLQRRYTKAVEGVKRSESRLTRAFNAWARAKQHLKASERLLDSEPPGRDTSGCAPFSDDLSTI
jgi:hypothetical protein